MELVSKLSNLDNIEDGETRKLQMLTAGDGIVIDENNVISTIDSGPTGTNNYNNLSNKPRVNGVILEGNKTSEDLGINIPTKLSDLENDGYLVTVKTGERRWGTYAKG